MRYVSGKVLTEEGFVNGHVGFEDGVVMEVSKGEAPGAEAKGVIVPTFIDAHTHLADLGVKVDLTLPLEDVVAPPNGLKHRYLTEAPAAEIRRSFEVLSRRMFRGGVSRFVDFRECGVHGSMLLRKVGKEGSKPYIMGRPSSLRYDREEVDELLKHADGVGVSSITDWPYEELEALAEHVVGKGRRFALHASERVREDIDKVLDLGPSFVVHMTKATLSDMEACRDAKVPIVVCPRSNMFFGNVPPLAALVSSGASLALGTDNAMIALPDMLKEMEFAARVLRGQGVRDVTGVLEMATAGGRLILNEGHSISIRPGTPCDFVVLRSPGGDPLTDLVLRSSENDVRMVCVGSQSWRGWR
ncbi:MAG: amidohydrolase family protein [Euryarchaeota archaeon]|nr:amidohydrolase family protein [Euryarchaeota archaeon]